MGIYEMQTDRCSFATHRTFFLSSLQEVIFINMFRMLPSSSLPHLVNMFVLLP